MDADALVGYDHATKLNENFNVTQHHWYDRFYPTSKPGTLCDPHIFSVYDEMVTTHNIFRYKIGVVEGGESGSSGAFSYSATPLDACDVDSFEVDVDVSSWTASIEAWVRCEHPTYHLEAVTTFTASFSLARSTVNHPINDTSTYSNSTPNMYGLSSYITLMFFSL
jgi:hypothetical protein